MPGVMCDHNQPISARNGGNKHIVRTNGCTAPFQISANAAVLLCCIVIKWQAINTLEKFVLFGS